MTTDELITDNSHDAPEPARQRSPWLAAAAAALFVVSVITAVTEISGYHPGGPYRPNPIVPVQPTAAMHYRPGKISHACAALDLSAIDQQGMREKGSPVGSELIAGDVMDSGLECYADFEGAGVTATLHMAVDYTVSPSGAHNKLRESKHNASLSAAGENADSPLSKKQALVVRRDGEYNSDPTTSHDFITETDVADGNLFATITFTVYDTSDRVTSDEVKQQSEHQMIVLLSHL